MAGMAPKWWQATPLDLQPMMRNVYLLTELQHITFERQVRNLLLQSDRSFQRDPVFAYVCWNIIQKAEVNKHVAFRTNASLQSSIVRDVEQMAPLLSDLMKKWDIDPNAKPSNNDEKKAIRTLNRLKVMAKDLKGTDICDPLLGAMGGVLPEDWASMTATARKMFVAQNPATAAQFFDQVIQAFVRIVLKYNSSVTTRETGLFGRCSGYYGMVEAQGRGTLHCHMLVWIEGNPSPQELRDKMKESPAFQSRVFSWLESIIRCQLPSTTEVVEEPDGPLKAPNILEEKPDPRLTKGPNVKDMGDEEFAKHFRETVEDLVILSNWHDHTETCWKHLKNGEPRTDESCRMRVDGKTNPLTKLDPETESIVLKRLHPRINNYNDLVIFLLRCNMDIKYIGSGEAAKALVYYITDYITKGTLSTHVGLSALEYAIKRNNEKFDPQFSASHIRSEVNRSLFTKTIMSLMSKQEMSHQQVMSYLVGGGDCYTSHTFKVLRWGEYDRFISKLEKDAMGTTVVNPVELTGGEEEDEETEAAAGSEQITVIVNDNYVSLASAIEDYPKRSSEEPFFSMSLWDHEENVMKISQTSEDRRADRTERPEGAGKIRGRKAEARGQYLSSHSQHATHLSRVRTIPVVNVLLGDKIPRPDRGAGERERWCRAMLILFKPWRSLTDLKDADETWQTAFDKCSFGPAELRTMKNMNVENECKDAKDSHEVLRKQGKARPLLPGRDTAPPDTESLWTAMERDAALDGSLDEEDVEPEDESGAAINRTPEAEQDILRVLAGLSLWKARGKPTETISDCANVVLTTDDERARFKKEWDSLKLLGKNKRPAADPIGPEKPAKRFKRTQDTQPADAATSVSKLQFISDTIFERNHDLNEDTVEKCLEDVLTEMNIRGNDEQERAVRIVAEHFISGSEQQLLLYVAGVGGAGKSHVIKALVQFFRRCGVSHSMMLSAPTGCAAVLIDGYTIHALTFLPKKKDEPVGSKTPDLAALWHDVRYLIIDEISMVSADLFAQISARLNEGKAMETKGTDNMFGRVNVVVLGDMGQLRPVRARSLFAHQLVRSVSAQTRETCAGVEALYGAWLWREFTKVVILRKNFRAANDPRYINLLSRVRLGEAWDGRSPMTKSQRGDGQNYQRSDYDTVKTRQMLFLTPEEQRGFADAPIVCSTKVVRDLLNRELTQQHGNDHRTAVHDYYSRDSHKSKPLNEELKKRAWMIHSSLTKDSIGRLPLAVGMKVMVMENIALSVGVVNGAEGILKKIYYSVDERGRRYADCVNIELKRKQGEIETSSTVCLVPESVSFKYVSDTGQQFSISRVQLPLLPSYAYTDYKSQGRSLKKAILDLNGCFSLQSVYVMLSRATSLQSFAVLRPFKPTTMTNRLGEEFRAEFQRLEELDTATTKAWEQRNGDGQMETDEFEKY
ncbi:PIF1-like helicase-domain-containing protein [Favolaschia claudopus]|uniref:ATP-dependent DNA helicase n=1 Tax=Favolaschia claudopus TaxID=2862362 RepID=A0AAW0BM50_9AGAR